MYVLKLFCRHVIKLQIIAFCNTSIKIKLYLCGNLFFQSLRLKKIVFSSPCLIRSGTGKQELEHWQFQSWYQNHIISSTHIILNLIAHCFITKHQLKVLNDYKNLFLNFRVLFSSSVLNLAELIALRPDLQCLRKIVYFHENQLVYPVKEQKERDFQYGYNQILTWYALLCGMTAEFKLTPHL